MMRRLAKWMYRRYCAPFTVACDRAPFWNPMNDRELLFHVEGLAEARSAARGWVWEHSDGQARIIEGHAEFPCEV